VYRPRFVSAFAILTAVTILPAWAAAPAWAAPMSVQQGPTRPPSPPAPPQPWALRLERGPERLMEIVMNRRARLGINVNLRARDTDSIGAYVDAVTPGGPADKAGIRSGDIITKLNGEPLDGERAAEGNRRSMPGLQLIELAAKLEPNDTVAVEFRRGQERKTVSVVTADEPDIAIGAGPAGRRFAMRFPAPGQSITAGDFPEIVGVPAARYRLYGLLADLELAPLNPELGRYFGTSEGVLVISAPKRNSLKLRGGDVILAVDGRKPANPSHLLRILRSYEKDETCKLELLRNRKRETVTARLDDRGR
jgi:membrane-associated protease RseP (regulator of RpoE activity)